VPRRVRTPISALGQRRPNGRNKRIANESAQFEAFLQARHVAKRKATRWSGEMISPAKEQMKEDWHE
jgi:alpha-D-ribose 1-methylphosphonate 5-triphosphate synthase subunit PhnG